MATIDLDAARAARAAESENKGKPHELKLGGQSFSIPPEMPFKAAEAIGRGNIDQFFELLLNGQHEEFAEQDLSLDDLVELTDSLMDVYGMESLGESLASRTSALSTGKPSRPTSKRTTT